MGKRILVINGHPDARPERFCAALAGAYEAGAVAAGHDVRKLTVGEMEFPLIRSRGEFEDSDPPPVIQAAQAQLLWAQHIVIVHPLWLGSAPALLKGFLEQAFRYGFAMPQPGEGMPRGLLSGRSCRLIVTMGMPGSVYRAVFGAFGVRAMERGILGIAGIRPIRHSFVGQVEVSLDARKACLAKVGDLGLRGV